MLDRHNGLGHNNLCQRARCQNSLTLASPCKTSSFHSLKIYEYSRKKKTKNYEEILGIDHLIHLNNGQIVVI